MTLSAARVRAAALSTPSPRCSLVAEYDYLAQRIARRYMYGHAIDEDLVQVARLGLVEATTRYDPEQGPFSSFAAPTIVGTLKKHLRSTGWAVHVPRSVQEQTIAVENCVDSLTQRLGRAPEMVDIADATGLSIEDVIRARRAREGRFSSGLPSQECEALVVNDDVSLLRIALESLDPDDRQLITWRYTNDLTQQEMAEKLGVSQPQIYRRLRKITTRLRDELVDPDATVTAPTDRGLHLRLAESPGQAKGECTRPMEPAHRLLEAS